MPIIISVSSTAWRSGQKLVNKEMGLRARRGAFYCLESGYTTETPVHLLVYEFIVLRVAIYTTEEPVHLLVYELFESGYTTEAPVGLLAYEFIV